MSPGSGARKAENMVGTLEEIKDVMEMSYNVRALIYGPPGVGKTVMACHSPNPFLMDADGTGSLSLLNHPELAAKTRVLQVKSYNQMLDVFEAKKAGHPRLADRQTFIIDTLSQLAKRHLDEVVDKEKLLNPQRDAIPFQRDYKFNTEGMRRLIGFFLELDVNIIVLAHEVEEKDERSGIVKIRPDLTPKLASTMEGVFDVFGYMTSDTDANFETTRTLQVMPSYRVKAKTRLGGLPPLIADPLFDHFLYAKKVMVDNLAEYRRQQEAAAEAAMQALVPPPVEQPETPVEEAPQQGAVPLQVGATFTLGEPTTGDAAPEGETQQ